MPVPAAAVITTTLPRAGGGRSRGFGVGQAEGAGGDDVALDLVRPAMCAGGAMAIATIIERV